MVEIRLDTGDHERFKSEHFVAVRIGEAQKMTKLGSTRSYKFPNSAVGERKYGKVEVYKRIGSCAVAIDGDAATAPNEYRIKIGSEEEISFSIAVNRQNDGAKPEGDVPTKTIHANARVAAARSYLEKHHLEVRIADAMQAVLRERPEDPGEFLATKILQNASLVAQLPKPSVDEVPNDLKSAPPPEVPKNLKSAPQEAVVPAPEMKSAPPPEASTSKPVPSTKPEPPRQHFSVRPSVGTWMSKALARKSVPKAAPQAIQAAQQPTPVKARSLLPFSTYYGTHLLPKVCLDSVYARFPVLKAAPVPKTAPAQKAVEQRKEVPKVEVAGAPQTPVKAVNSEVSAVLQQKAAAPESPAKAKASFAEYYSGNFQPLGAEVMDNLCSSFSRAQQVQKTATVEVAARPPPVQSNVETTGGAPQAERESNISNIPAVASGFKHRPSVGAWLISNKATDNGAGPVDTASGLASATVVEADSASCPADAALVQVDSASCPADPAPVASFQTRPSVGTWLQKLPQERPKKQGKQDEQSAPILEAEQKCPKVGMLNTQFLFGPSFFSFGLQPSVTFY